ncbi:MAG TPA: Zn-dependent hydrolase [Thermoanaerobaculia bacterium]
MRQTARSTHVLVIASLLVPLSVAAARPAPAKKTAAKAPAASAQADPLAHVEVAADLEARLARWKPVPMPFDASGLSPRERQLVDKLVEACQDLEDIYWRQSDPGDIQLYNALVHSTGAREKAVARMLWIHGGRWDLLDEDRPFLDHQPAPLGRALYPATATRQSIEGFVAKRPSSKASLLDEHTVVVLDPHGLLAVPYHVAYRRLLEPAAKALEEAAALSDDPAFAKFLKLRAKALLTDDYYESDLAWLDLAAPKFDLIFAPYETYLDNLMGVKTSYGAAVLVRNEAESRKLEVFQKYVAEIQDALPLAPEDRPSKHGRVAPMEVMDTPFRAGDLRHGYQAVADNLPNDPRVHEKKGSKRIFFKNFMDARVNEVVLPIAGLLMRQDQATKVTADGYLTAVLLHEISHGLGPAFARQNGKQVDIRQAIGPVYSGLEEAKADAVGMYGLAWLVDHGALPKERLEEYYDSYVGGIFRTIRFGTAEAHGRAEMMEFNYLYAQHAITRGAASQRYVVEHAAMPPAIAALAKELLEQEATGDRARAEAWFKKYDTMLPFVRTDLERASGVPVDIDPQGSFPEGVQ